MKKALVVFITLVTAVSALAGRIELTRDTPLMIDNGGYIGEYGWFLNGNRMTVADRSTFLYARGREVEVYRVRRINTRGMRGRRLENALDVNDQYVDVYITRRDLLNNSIRVRDTRPVVVDRPTRPVIVDRPVRDNSYEVCYEQPRRKVVRINQEQRQRGENRVGGGLFGVVAGQVIGGITDNRDLGNLISAVSAGFVIAGGIDMAQSREVIFERQFDCRQYYNVGRSRTVRRNGQTCTTTRYYTSRWGRTTEYFETSCSRGGRYMSFERNSEYWY